MIGRAVPGGSGFLPSTCSLMPPGLPSRMSTACRNSHRCAVPPATIALHSLVEREQFGDLGRPLPPALAPLLDRYREIYQRYEPADARYLENHRGHLMFLRPEEQALCTAELIRATTFTASRDELRERVGELRRAGFSHVGVTIRHGHPEMLEEWGKRDPIDTYSKRLREQGVDIEEIERSVADELERETEWALSQPMPDPATAADDVFATSDPELGDGQAPWSRWRAE